LKITADQPERQALRKSTVAVIEDDPVHAEIAKIILQHADFSVSHFLSASEFRRHASSGDFDLLLVDWELPGESGLEFLRQVRECGLDPVPVIFLTAVEDEVRIVEALGRGADDFIVKPAKPAELVARVRAVIRRFAGDRGSVNLSMAPFEFDLAGRRLTRDGEPVSLTPREFDLALYLFQRVGRMVSRESLQSQVWGTDLKAGTRSLDTYASRLRKRLGLDGSSGFRLEGIYQHGYRLNRHLPVT